MTQPFVYTPDEVALILKCSPAHVRAMIGRGEIPAFRLGGKLLRIRAEDLDTFMSGASGNASADASNRQSKDAGGSVADSLARVMRERRLSDRLRRARSPKE